MEANEFIDKWHTHTQRHIHKTNQIRPYSTSKMVKLNERITIKTAATATNGEKAKTKTRKSRSQQDVTAHATSIYIPLKMVHAAYNVRIHGICSGESMP